MEFTPIYNEYWTKVYRLCMGYVNDAEWARDIAQDTFVTVFQQLPAFRQEAAVGTWIFRIACNNCLRQIGRDKRLPRAGMPVQLEDRPEPDQEGRVNFLYQCIASLPETDRLAISLELEDVRQAEIASILGLSEGAVRVRLHRIREKLTQKFQSYEH